MDTLGRTFVRSLRGAGRSIVVADSFGGERSGDQLADAGFRVANALRAAGFEPGDGLAIMGDDRVETIEAYIGCFIAGVTAVHVNARLRPPEVEHILDNSGARGLVAGAGVDEVVSQVAGVEELTLTVSTGGEAFAPYQRLLDGAPSGEHLAHREAEDIAIIGYTSGTSGRPKGAMASERAVGGGIRHSAHVFRIPMGSRCAFSGSLSFIGATWGQVLPHIYMGGRVDLMGRYDVDSWFDLMAAKGTTFTYVPTPHMRAFAEKALERRDVLDQLATVFHTGSLAPPEWAKELNEVVGGRYLEAWGMTEAVGALTVTTVADHSGRSEADDIYATAGRVVPFAEVWAEGPDGTRLGPHEDGELVATSETMVSGYIGTDERIEPGGTYRTGDVGRFDEAGYLYVTGRVSDMIVSGGMNVYPAEVERVLVGHPDVSSAAVFGVPHERWGESVAAAVVRRPGSTLDEAGLVEFVRQHLASYKKPTLVEFLDELPLNASQKIDKRRLRSRFEESS